MPFKTDADQGGKPSCSFVAGLLIAAVIAGPTGLVLGLFAMWVWLA